MVGAGHQSTFQVRAAVEQRDFEKIVAEHPEMLLGLQSSRSAESGFER